MATCALQAFWDLPLSVLVQLCKLHDVDTADLSLVSVLTVLGWQFIPQCTDAKIIKMLERRALTFERVDSLEELIAREW
eukprot:1039445-Pyramimonas_sp.AAC.1